MVINLSKIKSLIWFCAILFMVLSFPIQVYVGNPYPSLIPYFLIGFIILVTLLSYKNDISNRINSRQNRNINYMVSIYLFLLLLNTGWQTAFGVISFYGGMSVLVIYLLPVVFYWYFRRGASEREIRSVLLAMIVASVIVGIYFAYDSYLKLALGQVSDYAKQAFQYSIGRANVQDVGDANVARISPGYRSFGLLESHSVSSAWVVLGAFAALTLLPQNRRVSRRLIILVFGIMLVLGLNFTAIISYTIIIFLFEFGGLSMIRGQFLVIIRNFIPLTVIIIILIGVVLWVPDKSMSKFIVKTFSFQTNLLLGTGNLNLSMVDMMLNNINSYFKHIYSFPLSLLLGDGFGNYGFAKGGDFGFVETMAKFGLPYFLAVVYGFFCLIRSGLRRIKAISKRQLILGTRIDHGRTIQFSIYVTLLILINEGHYTIWDAKSILPIVFFALALYNRYPSTS